MQTLGKRIGGSSMTGKALAVIGYQFGDEGKGKIVDMLCSMPEFYASVRFNGGNNAGHTIVKNKKKFKLHIIPSSIIEGKRSIISHGTVIDPVSLLEEISMLDKSNIRTNSLTVCENAHVIMPFHIEKDMQMGKKVGTTGRGIGPTYADKAHRLGVLVGDLADEKKFRQKMKDLKNVRETAAMEKYIETGSKIRPYVGNSFEEISKILEENKNIILEGAQGTLLDVDLGNYPYVTSSHTTVAGALSGTGLSRVDAIIGVVKSYITRVGNGPLPTELTDETGKKLQTQGNEIGTTTGRTRRCGWLDLPLLKYAAKVNGIKNSSLAVTKLDVFSGFDKIMVCTAYDINGKKTEMPFNVKNLESVKPVYEEMDGWNIEENEWNRIAKEGYEELPSEAKKYLEKIENFTGIPVSIVSIGPERSRTVFKKNITGFLG